MDLQAAQPQFKDGPVYRPLRPTRVAARRGGLQYRALGTEEQGLQGRVAQSMIEERASAPDRQGARRASPSSAILTVGPAGEEFAIQSCRAHSYVGEHVAAVLSG